jgi:hypothetical protein
MEPARKFKIIVNSKECGKCSGPTPSAVAKKVVKKLCGTSSNAVRFSLKECKRGCERVCGPYQGRMEKLDRPYKRDGKTITHLVVCGKIRKMRGGRALRIADFKKREGDDEFRIDKNIGLEPHIFFGLSDTDTDNDNKYNYVIYCESWFGGKVVIRDNEKNEVNTTEIKDTNFIDLLASLNKYLKENTKKNQFRRIKEYLNSINKNNHAQENRNGSVEVIKPKILENRCIEYPAKYQFSGKNINGKPYNTNNLFRGRGNNRINRKLYVYYPELGYYSLLLTELDYLVNVYHGNIPAITYSGLLKLSDRHEPSQIRTGNTDKTTIPITDINSYLYCPNESSFPEKYNKTKPIKIRTTQHNNKKLEFPCWIIVIKKINEYLTVKDFSRVSNEYFEIKNIGGISYLFLYSDESSDESSYYKFSISDDCKIFLYSNEEMTEYSIDENNIELFVVNRLFKLLNKQNISGRKIINTIMMSFSQYTNIINCLEKLHSMYEKYKRTVNPEI